VSALALESLINKLIQPCYTINSILLSVQQAEQC